MNKYILSMLALLLPIAFVSRISQIGALSFYLLLMPVDYTSGVIFNVQKDNGVQGGLSYEYLVNYKVDGKQYELNELFSPDSLINVCKYDSVKVKYSKAYPQYATLKDNKAHFTDIGLFLLLLFFEIIIIKETWKLWRQWHKNKKN